MLASGGHFAAAIFQWRETNAKGGNRQPPAALEVVLHKTFHKYVVRSAAAGAQGRGEGRKRGRGGGCC